jgi:SAM-dependent methyltransferase
MTVESHAHWQSIYEERSPEEVSWYEPVPERSLELIDSAGIAEDAPIIDVGGGASALAGRLLSAGYVDITVADISPAALELARAPLGADAERVTWVVADVRDARFGRQFELWHDRAVFHFMVDPGERDAYLSTLKRSLRPGGWLIVATFGPHGPTRCSGLPVRRYGADALAAELGVEFELDRSELDVHRTPSGTDQQFLYATFRRHAG